MFIIRRHFTLTKLVFQDLQSILNCNSTIPIQRLLLQSINWFNYSEAKIVSDCLLLPILSWLQTRKIEWLNSFSIEIDNLLKHFDKICIEVCKEFEIDQNVVEELFEISSSETDESSESNDESTLSSSCESETTSSEYTSSSSINLEDIEYLQQEIEKYRKLADEKEKVEGKSTKLLIEDITNLQI